MPVLRARPTTTRPAGASAAVLLLFPLLAVERELPKLREQGFVPVGLRDYIALNRSAGDGAEHARAHTRRK